MENLLLPRRERLFNNGGKLHFQNFSALFQGALSTSFPSGKYHCKAKSLSKTISRLKHIIAKGIKVSLPGDASYASLLTNRLSQAAVGCLMLAYSFSPRVHSIPRGPLYNARTASEERSKRLHLRKSNAADIANNRTQSVKCKALARMRGC